MLIEKLLIIVVSLSGLYLIYISIKSYKKGEIIISGEFVYGEKAKKYSTLGILIGSFFILVILLYSFFHN